MPDEPVVHNDPGVAESAAGDRHGRIGAFLRELAHELGNIAFPLRLIIELQNRAGQVSGNELTEVLQHQVEALQNMTRRLQQVGRCLSTGIEPSIELLPPREIIDAAVAQQQDALRDRQHSLTVNALDAAVVEGDRELLTFALAELLSNAANHAPPGGRIEVSLETGDHNVVFAVRDNGPGIPAELLPCLFEPFVTGDRRLAIGAGSIGCGLALARRVMADHGGAVEVRRTSPAGTEVVLVVPRQRIAAR